MQRTIRFSNVLRVASNRQIRRVKNHPIRLRALQRLPAIEKEILPLTYTPSYVPEKVSYNGWSPAPESPLPGLPFKFKRTAKGMQLPVYRDFRNGNTRIMTILRRFEGDEAAICDEVSKLCDGKKVSTRPGRIEVQGDYQSAVRKWMVGLGF